VGQDMAMSNAVMERLAMVTAIAQPDKAGELRKRLDAINEEYDCVLQGLPPDSRRQSRMCF